MKCKMYKVRGIERGKLPSGTMAYLGWVKIKGQIINVASMNKEAGSWFSLPPVNPLVFAPVVKTWNEQATDGFTFDGEASYA